MKRFAVAVGLVAAVLSMCALARANNALQPTVISLAQYSVTATPTDQAHQSYVFALSSKTGDTPYVFEVAQDAGGAILLLIAGNRTSVDQETKLKSRHHERTELTLRPIPLKTSRTGKALSHELVSIKWSGAESNETAEAESFQDPRLKKLYSDLRRLVSHHYPDATFHWLNNKISFEFNTRVFIIHVPLKTGEWQDPWEQRGPKKGGIYGTIELRDGMYRGAAMVPQTFDQRYYSIALMAPYPRNTIAIYTFTSTPQGLKAKRTSSRSSASWSTALRTNSESSQPSCESEAGKVTTREARPVALIQLDSGESGGDLGSDRRFRRPSGTENVAAVPAPI